MRTQVIMEAIEIIPTEQRRIAIVAAQSDHSPVLISGDTGTGKSTLARWIHSKSPRHHSYFFLGTQKQSLATQILNAGQGTLLIQNIDKWPLGEQKILFHYLRTQSIPAPGDPSILTLARARIMTTSNHSLLGRAEGGLFNVGLFRELASAFHIQLPSLLERSKDLERISLSLLKKITQTLDKEHIQNMTLEAWKKLKEYSWPGNFRELEETLKVAALHTTGSKIEADTLPRFENSRIDTKTKKEAIEKAYITELLKSCNWIIEETSQRSHLDRTILLEKIAKYHIEKPIPLRE